MLDNANDTPPLLSDVLAQSQELTSRRGFLGKSALSLVVGGAALAACRSDAPAGGDSALTRTPQGAPGGMDLQNPNSRLDTALHDQVTHGPTTQAPTAAVASYHRFDPTLPPLPAQRTQRIAWRAMEVPVKISADTTVAAWTFEGDMPGPIVHCRVGDTIEFTLQ